MDRSKRKIVSCSSLVTIHDRRFNDSKTMTVYEGVRKLLANNKYAQDQFSSNDLDVIVKLNSTGSVLGVSVAPKNIVSSSDDYFYCSCNTQLVPADVKLTGRIEMETLLKNVTDDVKMDSNSADECDNTDQEDAWWREGSKKKVEGLGNSPTQGIDPDLTLEFEEDNEAECMEITLMPDVIEATQLPPERISGILKNVEHSLENGVVKPDSTMLLGEEKNIKVSFDDEEPWKECWNCKAPRPPSGIHRGDVENLRIRFCCDKPCRIKPTNTAIEWGAKSYPYDSWVNHGFS